jgi:hypothetical protein
VANPNSSYGKTFVTAGDNAAPGYPTGGDAPLPQASTAARTFPLLVFASPNPITLITQRAVNVQIKLAVTGPLIVNIPTSNL